VQASEHKIVKNKKITNVLFEKLFVYILYTNYNYQYVVMHVCQLLEAGGWRGACIGHCEVATVVSSAFIKASK
jgi:hypothetical protein